MTAINPAYVKTPGTGGAITPVGAQIPSGGIAGDIPIKTGPGDTDWIYLPLTTVNAAVGCVFDGASSVLEVGRFVDVPVPYNCTIQAAEMLVDTSGGTLTVEVWKDSYANFPPTVADKINASAPIGVSGTNKSLDTTLTGWSLTLVAGDILRFVITVATVVTKATVFLKVLK